jgi:hypothetical protein
MKMLKNTTEWTVAGVSFAIVRENNKTGLHEWERGKRGLGDVETLRLGGLITPGIGEGENAF